MNKEEGRWFLYLSILLTALWFISGVWALRETEIREDKAINELSRSEDQQ
jgi:Na+-transporting methylmalonyl-CoA/oxaloacetate decarboxylase gamma subunit